MKRFATIIITALTFMSLSGQSERLRLGVFDETTGTAIKSAPNDICVDGFFYGENCRYGRIYYGKNIYYFDNEGQIFTELPELKEDYPVLYSYLKRKPDFWRDVINRPLNYIDDTVTVNFPICDITVEFTREEFRRFVQDDSYFWQRGYLGPEATRLKEIIRNFPVYGLYTGYYDWNPILIFSNDMGHSNNNFEISFRMTENSFKISYISLPAGEKP
jgi:hypothetical protein